MPTDTAARTPLSRVREARGLRLEDVASAAGVCLRTVFDADRGPRHATVRYQTFREGRERGRVIAARHGVDLTRFASSWAPLLIARPPRHGRGALRRHELWRGADSPTRLRVPVRGCATHVALAGS